METKTVAKRKSGRPKKLSPLQEQMKEVIKEVIRTVEVQAPKLEGFELYSKLKDTGYYQGGSGYYMENSNGIDKVYVPQAQEIISFFSGDPEKWDQMRDGIIRAYLEIYESNS